MKKSYLVEKRKFQMLRKEQEIKSLKIQSEVDKNKKIK